MKLAQALKLKNRLVGELNRLQAILQRENSRRSDNPSQIDREEIWNKILSTSEELISIKSAIATANALGNYRLIEKMAELKSRIAFLTNLPKQEGPELVRINFHDKEQAVYQWNSFINQQKCDELIEFLQKQANELQDEIDTYNATVEI